MFFFNLVLLAAWCLIWIHHDLFHCAPMLNKKKVLECANFLFQWAVEGEMGRNSGSGTVICDFLKLGKNIRLFFL